MTKSEIKYHLAELLRNWHTLTDKVTSVKNCVEITELLIDQCPIMRLAEDYTKKEEKEKDESK